jgi:PAP2 superfamily
MQMVMRFKFALGVPRPMEFSALVQPVILTPGYTAFPSGHATEAYFAAELLSMLHYTNSDGSKFPKDPKDSARSSVRGQLHRLAFRVAENRVVAGLHFPIDSVAGQLLGITLARYFVSRATTSSSGIGAMLINGEFPKDGSVADDIEPILDNPLDQNVMGSMAEVAGQQADPPMERVLPTVWSLAKKEWLS